MYRLRCAILELVIRRAGHVLGALVLILAVLSSLALGGNHYFYCDAMGLLQTDPCQAAASHATPRTADARETPFDCCDELTVPSLPNGAANTIPDVPPAALAAVIPPFEVVMNAPCVTRSGSVLARWRVPPPTATERRAVLMVFLT